MAIFTHFPDSTFNSCICVAWVWSLPCRFWRFVIVLSPFIMGKINTIGDLGIRSFFNLQSKNWTNFAGHVFLNILSFSDTEIRRRLTLFEACLCLNNTLSQDLKIFLIASNTSSLNLEVDNEFFKFTVKNK